MSRAERGERSSLAEGGAWGTGADVDALGVPGREDAPGVGSRDVEDADVGVALKQRSQFADDICGEQFAGEVVVGVCD